MVDEHEEEQLEEDQVFTEEQQYRESLDHQGLGNRGIILSGIWSLKAEGQNTHIGAQSRETSLPHLFMKATGSSLPGTKSPEWITSSGSSSVATIS
ncbi:hypothetical protein EYF80_035559 [Liparis tanakae]|uniref:Uncharacterized protein n=1 Tax=Liparis tanakae TaxID=230148 RepID=A0A4Z2GLQ3_9TELE|nr:hypothetical protein EYF80_035559 [Liparis tanakae]